MIVLDGTHLTIPDVIKVAREHELAELSPASRAAIEKARDFVNEKLEQQAVVYGLTTGFGRFFGILFTKGRSFFNFFR